MSDVRSLRERFLARTEQVRVRIPLDSDAADDLAAARQERQRIITEHANLTSDAETGEARKKITDPNIPADPDTAAVDQWIEQADREVDASSIVIVLQWVPQKYGPVMKSAMAEGLTSLEVAERMAAAYYLRAEENTNGSWQDLALSWDDVAGRLSEGELLEVGTQAQALANASDAAPFVKRGKNSGTS